MPQPDDRIIDLLTDLSGCLCAELTPEGEEEPPECLCGPIPGSFPGQTYAGEGDVAWVRLVDSFPSNTPGQQWQGPFDQALATSLVVELGVMRCFEWPSDGAFDAELLESLWSRQMEDLGAMRRALVCCTGQSWSKKDLVVGNYRPVTDGDMVGGLIAVALQI